MVLEIRSENGVQVFSNADDGLAAEVTEANQNHNGHSHRVIFRDTDADEVLAVIYGGEAQCIEQARAFVTGGGTL